MFLIDKRFLGMYSATMAASMKFAEIALMPCIFRFQGKQQPRDMRGSKPHSHVRLRACGSSGPKAENKLNAPGSTPSFASFC